MAELERGLAGVELWRSGVAAVAQSGGTMEQLEGLLDPSQFFRLNRAYLARQAAIHDIINYTNSRLQTILKPSPPESEGPVLVSREKVSVFKSWLDR